MKRLIALTLVWGCGSAQPARAPGEDPPKAAATPAPASTDSLVLEIGPSRVFLVEGRTGRGADGTTCSERGVEIRRDSSRIRVPLLYTGGPLTGRTNSAFEAELWRDCRAIAIYRIDLATGRPTKVRDR